MDLFAKNDKSLESTKELTDYEIKQFGNSKLLFDFEKDCTFLHGDKQTNLIKARIFEKYEKNTCIAPDTAKYVCFEVPTYITVKELAEKNVFDVLNQIGKFDDLMKKYYNNIGFIDRTNDERYKLFKPTSEVLSYTRDVLDEKIRKTEDLFTHRLQQQYKNDENLTQTDKQRNFRKEYSAKDYLEEKYNEEQKRKEEPFLEEQLRYKIGDKIYTNYKCTDITDGKVININRLENIAENENENLYSAYIHKVKDEDIIELKTLQDIPDGFPIMFTSQTKIEEISNTNNNEQLKKFLELISNVQNNKMKKNEITYIGGIDKEGRIIRTTENCSEQIKQKIEEKKIEFEEKMNKQKNINIQEVQIER